MYQDYGNFEFDKLSYVTDAVTGLQLKYKLPASCCTRDSSYQNKTCDKYYESGCTGYVKEFIAEIILIAASVTLIIGILQVRHRIY